MLFFNATTTTSTSTLSLHDALPISEAPARGEKVLGVLLDRPAPAITDREEARVVRPACGARADEGSRGGPRGRDRKSTRLNSSHTVNSYAVFRVQKERINSDNLPYP